MTNSKYFDGVYNKNDNLYSITKILYTKCIIETNKIILYSIQHL